MHFYEYVHNMRKTLASDQDRVKMRLNDDKTIDLLHACLGLQTETAELTDMIKKHIFYGREIDKVHVIEEMGDIMWYYALVIDTLDLDFNELLGKNIKKLRARYKGGFTETQAKNRDLKKERKILEDK